MGTPKNITGLEKKADLFSKEKVDYRTLFNSILFGVQEIDSRGTISKISDEMAKKLVLLIIS